VAANDDVPTCTLLLSVPADLTSTTVNDVRATLTHQLDQAATRPGALRSVHLDLRAATMIDSVGLNLIVALLKRVKAHGGAIIALVGHRHVERTLTFTRLHTQMQLVRAPLV
jgi:anti-anti-sigma factor